MDLLLTFDDNYTQHASVTITSFCYNNKGKHSFHIISNCISSTNQDKLQNIVKRYNSQIFFYFIEDKVIESFPIGNKTANNYINLSAYFRLFVADVLPQNIDRILYLDCDTVVNSDISDFWSFKFNANNCIGGVVDDPKRTIKNCQRLNYDCHYSYINSGVLIIDLTELRKHFNMDIAIQYISNHTIYYHDQDVINGLLYDKKQIVDLKYNLMDFYLIKGTSIPSCYKGKLQDAIHHPVVIHFSGPLKPWFKECRNPYKELYFHYLVMTPWKDYKPQSKYNSFKEKTIYEVKKTIKQFLDVLRIRNYSFIDIKK